MNDDLISRQASIKAIEELKNRYFDRKVILAKAQDAVNNMPTIDPVKWIPVSESLPKNDDWAIVTILDERGDTPFRYTDFGWYLEVANCWIVDDDKRTDIVAWMPLPKPWRGEEG